MKDGYNREQIINGFYAASDLLNRNVEEINKLNVFPVPDGDTGTNMSLTLQSIVKNISSLSLDAPAGEIRKAMTTGALMGARGNSGVITSQIVRGLCEGMEGHSQLDTDALADCFERAVEVAFQAVRKPVEGTILTVLKDAANEATAAREAKVDINDALDAVVNEAFASVERTPDFLPILKENNVVDAGGYGLAIAIDGFNSGIQGKEPISGGDRFVPEDGPKVEIEHIQDWEDSDYRYCNEFLVDSDSLDTEEALDFLQTMGDCELCVGSAPKFKVHVHSNHPDQVLKYFLDRGQISEVYIHNMDMQSQERIEGLKADEAAQEAESEHKAIGFVAVAVGEGTKEILKSLGVDYVVSGGQTMNPSTKDLLDAIEKVNADAVVVMPNNSNIIMAAASACELADKNCAVVPTKSVPESFSAMLAVDPDANLIDNVAAMSEAAEEVKTGEVTTAIKNSKDKHKNKIKKGDIIGIADGEIEVVGSDVADVVMALLATMDPDDADNLTLLGGEDFPEVARTALVNRIEKAYPYLEVDSHDGGQPLYPVVFSLE